MRRFTAAYLHTLPTLNSGHFDNLKIDDGDVRVWLSRCSTADGEPYDNKITIERLVEGKWRVQSVYEG